MQSVKSNIYFTLIILVFSFLVSCSHKVLSVFFDGVPETNDSVRVAVKKSPPKSDSLVKVEATGDLAGIQNSVHPPFQNKKCGLCHDQNAKGKLQMPQPGLCFLCHDDFGQKFKYIHGPVASGYCNSCHNPHKSEFKKLLLREGQDLCLYCHDSKQIFRLAAHEKIGNNDCISCHDPHGGNKQNLLADK